MSLSFHTRKHEALKQTPIVLFRKLPVLLCMLTILVMIGVGLPNRADADPYFNSSSENCTTASHPAAWVLCDDFEDGGWYVTINDPNNSANDGWLGANGQSLRNPPPPAATCSGTGAAGTNCTAVSSPRGGDGGDSALGMHGFSPNDATYNELWIRMYIKFLPGYTYNNNQKFFSLIRNAYQGGIDYGGVGHDLSEMEACPFFDCGVNNLGYLGQNQGNNLIMSGNSRWYYMEWHIKQNTYNVRNGTFQMWLNDCGTTGVCTGSPVLRSSYINNVGWQGGGGFNGSIGSMDYDIWGNPGDVGTINFDQLVVSTAGPIGFKGASGSADVTPPVAPVNLRIQ